MSEQDKSQQTEEATPKKKEQLRKDGKFAQSQDVVSAGVLVAGAAALTLTIGSASREVRAVAERIFRLRDAHHPAQALDVVREAFIDATMPIVLTATVAALAVGLTQSKLYFSLSNLAPKAERFSPMSAIKKMLPGKESGIEILKQVLKLGAVGVIVVSVLHGAMPLFIGLGASSLAAGAESTASVGGQVIKWAVLAFGAVAALDFILAKRKFDEESKMSKRDVRDEMKQDQGDPLIKRRQRQKMRELISKGGNVAEATVLVTNPTHLSIALRYDPEKDAAPVVIAKAADDAALRMRRKARKHGVPIVENKPFARAMYKTAKVGEVLPADLFGPAAAVIAHVLGLRGGGAAHGSEQARNG